MLESTFMRLVTCWGCCQRSKDATRLHCHDVLFWLQEIQKKNPNPPNQNKTPNQPNEKPPGKKKKGWLSQVIISQLSDRISFFQIFQDQPNGIKMEDSKCKWIFKVVLQRLGSKNIEGIETKLMKASPKWKHRVNSALLITWMRDSLHIDSKLLEKNVSTKK